LRQPETGGFERPGEGEIAFNKAYRELAGHYSAAVLSVRFKALKDQLSAENALARVATWVIAKPHKQTFGGLLALQAAVGKRKAAYNGESVQTHPGSYINVFTAENSR
jgi:hypothetical protein